MKLFAPAFAYFAPVFALGFALGIARTVWLAPQLGPVAAVTLEIPVMLLASWMVAQWLVRRFRLSDTRSALLVGALAFFILQTAEVTLTMGLGGSALGWMRELGTVEGLLGQAGQIVFAVLPFAAVNRKMRG